jgi:hypothetical protein
MNKAITVLKLALYLTVALGIVFLLYQVYRVARAASDAGASLLDSAKHGLGYVTPGNPSGTIYSDVYQQWKSNGENALLIPFNWGVDIGTAVRNWVGKMLPSGTNIVTPQTAGSSQAQINIPPNDVKQLTPSGQPGGVDVPGTSITGFSFGTLGGNSVPVNPASVPASTSVRGVLIPDASYQPGSFMDIMNSAPLNQPSDISQDQVFIGK